MPRRAEPKQTESAWAVSRSSAEMPTAPTQVWSRLALVEMAIGSKTGLLKVNAVASLTDESESAPACRGCLLQQSPVVVGG